MIETTLLRDLSVVMVIAAVTTLGCHLLRQPVVIGYLLAGFIIGPHTPPFSLISDIHSIETLAELGLVFLMFSVGLEFSLPKLRKVGPSAALAAILEIIGMVGIGYGLGQLFGWNTMDSLFLGMILSISSTTIIAKVFTDLKLVREEFAQVVFGILILEDVVAIVILALLSGLGASQIAGTRAVTALGQVAFFVTLFLVIGLALVPKFLRWIARFHSKELLGIVALGLCLASALLAHQLGFSVALGAFMMGSIIGVSSEIEEIESWIHPIRDMFSAIFFVSTGLLINPSLIMEHKWAIGAVALVTIFGKVLTGAIGSFFAGYSLKTSMKTGMSLAQIGEFSFVFAALALKSKQGSEFLYPMAVAVSALTALSTPYLIKSSDRVVSGFQSLLGEPFLKRLDHYHLWLEKVGNQQSGVMGFLSRYLVRLAIYASLFLAALILVTVAALGWRGNWIYQAIGWNVGFWITLPLIVGLATYLSHFVLISFTELLPRLRLGKFLEYIPMQSFYSALNDAALIFLTLSFWLRSVPFLPAGTWFWVISGIGVGVGILARHQVARAYEHGERVLDEALGLTTSEPLRQAALKSSEEGSGLLADSIERLLLRTKDSAVNRTVRSLGLREKTGASLIGIYRKGTFMPNPSPEEVLRTQDTLVLLGAREQRALAKQLLRGSSSK